MTVEPVPDDEGLDHYDHLSHDDQVGLLKERIKALERAHFEHLLVLEDLETGIYNPIEVGREPGESVEDGLARALDERRVVVEGLEKSIETARERLKAFRTTPRAPRDRLKSKKGR